jgi:acetate kinase
MNDPGRTRAVLALNCGSSSLKFALFDAGDPSRRLLSGRVERIRLPESRLVVVDAESGRRDEASVDAPEPSSAAAIVLDRVGEAAGPVAAVGHRIVHGGPRFGRPEPITDAVVDELRRLVPLDPDHLPGAIAIVELLRGRLPGVPQVACFDTAFHHDLPRVAQILPIPRRFEATGVRRYGFHGISYAYLMEELRRVSPEAARGRVVLAHLGAGASLAAVAGGRCIDTTMAMTPAAGLVMGTRSGDIDPGLVRFLARAEGLSADGFDDLVNHRSGLLGVSGTSPDFRELWDRRADDVRAAEAVDLFCYRVKTGIGAFAAALGGIDALVFAGGIGENASGARAQIGAGLDFLGIRLDPARNEGNGPQISADGEGVDVRVIRTDEEAMIAREVATLLRPF